MHKSCSSEEEEAAGAGDGGLSAVLGDVPWTHGSHGLKGGGQDWPGGLFAFCGRFFGPF